MSSKRYYIQKNPNNVLFSEYFDFNGIGYTQIDLYNNTLDTFGRYDLPEWLLSSTSNVLFLDEKAFISLMSWQQSFDHLVRFLNSGNMVIFSSDIDAIRFFTRPGVKELILLLDSKLNSTSVVYVLDGRLPIIHWGHHLVNSLVKVRPYSCFVRLSRLHYSGVEKYSTSYPYLITTILKRKAPHRNELYQQLLKKKSLFDQGLCIFNKPGSNFIGTAPILHDWHDGYASMDLYKNAWLEIVPETAYKDGYYFTEKTAKPIASKTPFLAISNMGYLDYLKSMGFKTFGHLISEKYNLEHRIEDRVRLAIEQLENIVNNGAEQFYKASLDVLEYNQKRLAEITGFWDIESDQFITQVLAQVDQ